MRKQQFTSSYTGRESFLTDHIVKGEKVLPGVTYLEMVRAAGEYIAGQPITQIKDVSWLQPLTVGAAKVDVHIQLTTGASEIGYEVSSQALHAQGKLSTVPLAIPKAHSLHALQHAFAQQMNGDDCYDIFRNMGLAYGKTFRGIQTLYYSADAALSKINLAPEPGFMLTPGIMDSALQTCMGMSIGKPGLQMMLPFSVREVNIFHTLTGDTWCYARRTGQLSYDLDLLNAAGEVLVSFTELVLLPIADDTVATHVYGYAWQSKELTTTHAAAATQLVLLAGAPALLADKLQETLECEVALLHDGLPEHLFWQVLSLIKKHKAAHIQLLYPHTESAEYGFIAGLLQTACRENSRISAKTIGVDSLTIQDVQTITDILLAEQTNNDPVVRYRQQVREAKMANVMDAPVHTPIKDNGVYIITGGAGGLGRIFAYYISKRADVILLGRSAAINDLPARTTYQQCDVTDADAVRDLIKNVKTQYGHINGIIHSAGVLRDSLIGNKTAEEVQQVFAAKITGAKHIVQATRQEGLDFIVFCSSIAGVFGNAGQSDYAAANAWLDNYAEAHEHVISINWPLWKDGGMHIDTETEKYLEQTLGLVPMPAANGLQSFEQLLGAGIHQGMVLHGKTSRIPALFNAPVAKKKTVVNDAALFTASIAYLRTVLATELRMPASKLEADAPFERFGIDSIMIMRLTNVLEGIFSRIPRTLFFECQTLQELTSYFVEEHSEQLAMLTGITAPVAEKIVVEEAPVAIQPTTTDGIAIIGISGKYPGAETLDEFWDNLKNGRDSITEVPADRWDVEAFYSPEKGAPGKSYSKWGGFLKHIDHFDPYFFNISPKEAALMDPQARLFLQTVWDTIEDAGYTRERLGRNVGVYAGVMYEEYPLFGAEERLKGNFVNPGGSPAGIANRVSYFLNLNGPSLSIDTMCSSSLTAIHLACESIQSGNCNMAIAGGVNISVHPNKYLMLSGGMFASSKGRCESFGEGGEGYVPGEGVGAVLLKPLSGAIADGDHIYGVIKGSAINHGGKTNGFTVPNPKAQTAVIKAAMKKAGVKAADFSYIEAHGTGTSLGDPIEIAGLNKAFDTKVRQYCRLGSVKSNIGHCESAAGISGLTKVLLQMKHQQLVPSLHADTLNPNIDFSNSPFKVQQALEAWTTTDNQPRIAGISGFGAGGSNAHIIIEEYRAQPAVFNATTPAIIVLSAQKPARLQELAANLAAYIRTHDTLSLHDIAYTLQTGREAMEERMAFVAISLDDLLEKLSSDQVLTGNTRKENAGFLLEGNAGKAYIESAIRDQELQSLAQLWVKGVVIDWSLLYPSRRPHVVSLPTYPFAKERHWIQVSGHVAGSKLHPLVHTNSSSLQTQQFTSVYTGQEHFFEDHQVKGIRILPGVAQLEMARAAAERSASDAITQIKDITFFTPLQPQTVQVNLYPAGNDIQYEITSAEGLHGSGTLSYTIPAAKDKHDLDTLRTGLQNKTGTECYELFSAAGMHYGPTFRGIDTLYYNDQLAISRIILPSRKEYILSPGILDSALQTCIGMQLGSANISLALPFSIRTLTMYRALPDTLWCYARRTGKMSYDIDLCDATGEVLVSITELVLLADIPKTNNTGLSLYTNTWQEAAISTLLPADSTPLILLAGGTTEMANTIQENLSVTVKVIDGATPADFFNNVLSIVKAVRSANIMVVCSQDQYQEYAFITGLLKTIPQENSRIHSKLLCVDGATFNYATQLIAVIAAEQLSADTEVRYTGGKRAIRTIQETAGVPQTVIKENGVYLITGGAGGLGLIFAEHISKIPGTQIILAGRSSHTTAILPARTVYMCCDVSDATAVKNTVSAIRSQYGHLHGIIHSAGVLRDSLIINKTAEEVQQVFAAKIDGVRNLYATAPEYMILCSSVAGVFGNAGQSDYAAANAWLNNFAEAHDNVISINWPLWKEGGMHIDAESEKYMEQHLGLLPLPTAVGLQAFDQLGNGGVVIYRANVKEVRTPVASASADIVRNLLADELSMQPEQLEADTPFERYGIDSVMVVRLTNKLEEVFGRLPRTLFFEYQSLQELTEYLQALAPVETPVAPTKAPVVQRQRFTAASKPTVMEDIAIIGLSGRYPGADNTTQFWENLKNGKDSITEIPADRWDAAAFYHPEKGTAGKSYSRWGGFMNDIDKFDPLFFNISPREAELMDPQERLFLQTVWETIEDAGYTRAELSRKVGVYAGVMYEEYQLFGAEESLKGNFVNPAGIASSIANRVSYFFNFQGPSMAVDTMCSSSLTAIHLACRDLQLGEAELAIAGGVNVSVHPNKYLMLSQGRFLSSTGRCESFGDGGDGYVPGEAVGAVLLKKLSQAIADGDHIYGVIKGTAVNHGGRTNGYTVPNPKAQAAVITAAIDRAGIPATDFSYIEAHGTGTSLGDPIEIAGLSKAFAGAGKQSCHIGSVKSNIGHCESAAGITGLTKVLLQLKHKQLVPSLHATTLNPNIDFAASPFVVQQRLEDWMTPNDRLRIAGISGFGAGGSNAHIIIQEYRPAHVQVYNSPERATIVLSAKNISTLHKQVQNLLQFLAANTDAQLHDIAYTLQQGREAMEERVAFIVADKTDLSTQLNKFLAGDLTGIYTGSTRQPQPAADSSLAAQWVQGAAVNWVSLYNNGKPAKISLPTYPFAKDRYWIPVTNQQLVTTSQLHPLLHTNESDLEEQVFTSLFTGRESFFNADSTLPAALLLEMVREAGERSLRAPITEISDVAWDVPVKALEKVYTRIFPSGDFIEFEVSGERGVHISGVIDTTPLPALAQRPVSGEQLSRDQVLQQLLQRPVALGAIQFYGSLSEQLWYQTDRNNVDVINEQGHVVLRLIETDTVNEASGMLYAPTWNRIIKTPAIHIRPGKHHVIGNDASLVDYLTQQGIELTNDLDGVGTVYLVQGLDTTGELIEHELQVFRTVKTLLASSLQQLEVYVFTRLTQQVLSTDEVQYIGSGINGLIGSLIKEQPSWQIHRIDLDAHTPWSKVIGTGGTMTAFRNGFAYQQRLYPVRLPEAQPSKIRQGGVYILLGGAGGIGRVTTEYLVQHYQANVIWLGRRAADDHIRKAQEEIAALGVKPLYFSCDANDKAAVENVYQQIKAIHKDIHGLFQSAIVLNDMLLKNMSEADFRKACDAKSLGSHHFVEAFSHEPLDFICFYSSVQALMDAPGQANYAAGCTYKDSFARSIRHIPVRIINWGYWGEVGIVAEQSYRERMEMAGVGSIQAAEGMRVLEAALASEQQQVVAIKLANAMGVFAKDSTIQPVAETSVLRMIQPVTIPYPNVVKVEVAFLELCNKGLLQVLLQMGWKPGVSSKTLGVIDKYEQLFGVLINLLEQHNINGFDLDKAIDQLANYHPEYLPHGTLLRICLHALPAILRGEQLATAVMFPGGSLEYVSGIYKGNAQSDFFNTLLAGIVKESVAVGVKQLKPGEKFRILEIGAGTGGTSQFVFKALQPYAAHVEYIYTDLSRSFLLHAEKEFKDIAPYLQTAILDIEQSPVQQQFTAGTCDIVIGANVIHATRQMDITVANIKTLLKRNGLLLMNEIARTELFTTLTFGLLDGWWLYEDPAIRLAGSPGLSGDGWRTVLTEGGYFDPQILPPISGLSQQIVCAKSNGVIRLTNAAPAEKKAVVTQTVVKKQVATQLTDQLIGIAADLIKLPRKDFDLDGQFMDYGFDSILGVELIKHVNEAFGITLKPTDIFNYPNIRQLAAYLEETYKDVFRQQEVVEIITTPAPVVPLRQPKKKKTATTDIAIIGMSGQFGPADDLEAYWEVLKQGRNLITDVPASRWPGGGYKGSYLNDIDKFDPLFFRISGKEAEMMDPQQRLFLQHCWKAIEDAAINPRSLKGSKCGVYVGVAPGDYSVRESEEAAAMWGNSSAILSSRISYLLDLKGPAISIDTACSSSLVAMDMGCSSLQKGDADLIITGGVNIMTTAGFHGLASRAGMLSPNGQCYAFDKRADGFVPGEGVGVVILKRLADAERDGDHIYGVIKASMTNQDGTSNGITAPSVLSQKELEKELYAKFNIDPSTISYVEAHGTGTSLGDPIELEALTAAFSAYTDKKQFCKIGSVKTNIGHTLVASGVAGVQKILLSLKHNQIPASLNYTECNPLIDLDNSPFSIPVTLTPWIADTNAPRRAAISSFGFSGTNAHMIIEEYRAPQPVKIDGEALIILSAKNADRLKEQVAQLVQYLQSYPDTNVHDIAYTLQTGREHMEERLAMIVSDVAGIIAQSGTIFTGNIKKDKTDFLLEGGAGQAYINYAVAHREISSLAQLWVKGVSIQWDMLYAQQQPRRISLPGYPFARQRYWVPALPQQTAVNYLHPLLHSNQSNLKGVQFTSTYTGQESFLQHHQINAEKILPGVAYLELARAAAHEATTEKVTRLQNVSWLSPLKVNGTPEKVQIRLQDHATTVGYEIYTDKGVHSQGKVSTSPLQPLPVVNVSAIRQRLTQSVNRDKCYEIFNQMGLQYGQSFRGIEQLYYNDQEALAKINVAGESGFTLSPGVLDSALQTCMGLSFLRQEYGMSLPFSVKEVALYKDLPDTLWSYARKSNGSKGDVTNYDVDLLNEAGEVLVTFRDFMTLSPNIQPSSALRLYTGEWEPVPATASLEATPFILLAGGSATMADNLKDELEAEVLVLGGETTEGLLAMVLAEVKEKIKEKTAVHIMLVCSHADYMEYGFVSGLLKTASIENAKISGKVICVESLQLKDLPELKNILHIERTTADHEVWYEGGLRKVKLVKEIAVPAQAGSLVKEGGVYLITGGAGGLGRIFAAHLRKVPGVKLVLIGRSERDMADYISCDVSNKQEVVNLIQTIKDKYGRLDGIIHSAGVIRDGLIVGKTSEDVRTVLAAKVAGVKHLDEATKDLQLDFMVFFAGMAGVMGNIGQADYAAANAFLDNYAYYREQERLKGRRTGKTLSIDWPLWKEGGMKINADNMVYLEKNIGMLPLPTNEGLRAFEILVSSPYTQGMVMYGNEQKFKPLLAAKTVETTITEDSDLHQQIVDKIREITAGLLKLQVSDIEADEKLTDYGFDSILLIKYGNELNHCYDIELTPATFYSYTTINELTAFIIKEYGDKLGAAPIATEIILPQSRYPLTEGQKGLYFIQQLEPGKSNYNVPVAFVLKGRVDSQQLKTALRLIVEEHPVLRSRFIMDEASGEVFNHIDNTSLFFDEAEVPTGVSIDAVCWQLVRVPFDLANDCPARLYVRRQGDRSYILFVFHHIIFDGMSSSLFLSAFFEKNQQLAAGNTLKAAAPNLSYFNYIELEQSYIKSIQGQKSLAYWEEKLAGTLPVLSLPFDMMAAHKQVTIGVESMRFNQQELNEMKALCRQLGINLSVLFMSVYTMLLHKLTSEEDLVVIMPTAGRPRKEFENSIGYYINMMITRNSVSPYMAFDELVRSVKDELINGMEHAAYPFPKLLSDLYLDDAALKVSFIYQNIFDELLGALDAVEMYDTVYQETAHVYSLEIQDLRKELIVNLKYDQALFLPTTIRQHLGYFRQLLKGVLENSTKELKAYSMISAAEIHHLLVERNNTAVTYPTDKTLADLFEEQVAKTPEQIAVVFDGRRVTYQELDAMANRLANHLEKAGLPLHAPVALVANKCLEQVWGVLGILKAGGHYIPVKGSLPENRLNELLVQTASPIVLAHPDYIDKVDAPVTLIALDETLFEQEAATHEKHAIADTELAYIIFTSGSTGKPKGVMIDHRGAVNTLYDMNARFGIQAADKVFGISDLNFDLSVYDIFGVFACGATLILPLEEERFNPDTWIKYVQEEQITVWNSVPQIVNLLIERQEDAGENLISSLRIYFMSGDWIPLDLPDRIKGLNAHSKVYSLGGATEGSIWSIYYPVEAMDPTWKSIPYGYPLGNQEMYVLDADLDPCPLNVPGDIYIGGVGVAKGYHNDPEKTGASFIYHPGIGKNLYRTGDLGSMHPDGYMVFLGRKDGQVKINGFRVELGEIETTLQLFPAVKQCIITTTEDAHRNKRLVAYVVANGVFNKEAMQEHLRAYLPDYMVPSLFVEIDSIPLSANGKVDHKALPAVDAASLGGKRHIAPADDIERRLADIWSQLLHVSDPGVHDDFFESGGNSLSMIQLAHKINTAFEKDLQLIEIMKHPTIAALKTLLTQEVTATATSVLTLREGASIDTAFIIPGALGSTEGYLGLADQLPVEGAVYGLQMKGVNGEAVPNTSIAEMAAYNLELIRQAGVSGGITLVGHSYAGIVLYEMLRQATDMQIERVIMLDCFINPLSDVDETGKLATYFRSLILFTQPGLADEAVEALISRMVAIPEVGRMAFIFDTVSSLPAEKVAQMWAVFNASLSATYQPEEKLDYKITFIQADNSGLSGEDWGTAGAAAGWDQYFADVLLITTTANHFTIVNAPLCNEWIAKINVDQILPIV